MKRFQRLVPLLLLLTIWSVIIGKSPFCDIFDAQTSSGVFYQEWPYGPLPIVSGWQYSPQDFLLDQPFNINLLAVVADKNPAKFGAAYDPLIQKFPRDAWLIARRLQKAAEQLEPDRVGGELSDYNFQANQAAGIPSPERSGRKPNYTQRELQNLIALARRGRNLEPDNAYWYWAEACVLLYAWRDKEAWPLIAAGSRKKRFDSHLREWVRANVAHREIEVGRPLLWEEKIAAHGDSAFLYSRLDREAARIIRWEGIKAERRGDHARALQIYSDFARLMYRKQSGAFTFIEASNGWSNARLALGGDKRKRGKRRPQITGEDSQYSQKGAKFDVRDFADYAKAHGRADLVQEMTPLAMNSARQQDLFRQTLSSRQFSQGIPARPLKWAITLWWSASLLLLILPMLPLWRLLLGLALRLAHVPKVEVPARDAWLATAGTFLMTGVFWGVAFLMGAGWRTALNIGWHIDLPRYYYWLSHILLGIGLIAPGLTLTEFCNSLAKRAAKMPKRTWREKLSDIRLSALLSEAALGIGVGICVWWWLLCLNNAGGVNLFYYLIALPPSLTAFHPLVPQGAYLLGLLFFWLRSVIATPAEKKPLVAAQLRLLHQALGATLLAGSALYLVLLLFLAPLLTQINRDVDLLIERGQIRLMLQNATLKTPLNAMPNALRKND